MNNLIIRYYNLDFKKLKNISISDQRFKKLQKNDNKIIKLPIFNITKDKKKLTNIINKINSFSNNKKIFIYSKKPNQFSNKENLIQITNFNLIKNQKFSVIYIENLEYSYELITNITKSSLENLGYLIIKFSTLSQNPKIFFEKMSKQFELLQEINIESFSKNNFLIIFKSRN